MCRKILVLSAILSITAINNLYAAESEPDKGKLEQYRIKLMDIIKERRQSTDEYKKNEAEIEKIYADKLSQLKKEFHSTRTKYLNEKKDRLTKLETDYKNKMLPLEQEESNLRAIIEPVTPGNFAKTRR